MNTIAFTRAELDALPWGQRRVVATLVSRETAPTYQETARRARRSARWHRARANRRYPMRFGRHPWEAR
jgi:hypothetical protein